MLVNQMLTLPVCLIVYSKNIELAR